MIVAESQEFAADYLLAAGRERLKGESGGSSSG